MHRKFQLFYLAHDKSKELSVIVDATGFEEAKKFFATHWGEKGFELTRIKEVEKGATV